MIKDGALGNYLNSHKKGENSNTSDKKENIQIALKNPILELIPPIITLFLFVGKSIVFGYSLKLILSTAWNFWELLCIGLAISFVFNYIYDLFHKN